jgi:hypothetical protein
MFDMWLNCEADMAFGFGYIDKFKKHFSQYMNKDIEQNLYIAGKNINFAISTYMEMYDDDDDDVELDDVLKFTEKFIENQIIDFDNWCDEISMAMYEESSDYERDEQEYNKKKEISS